MNFILRSFLTLYCTHICTQFYSILQTMLHSIIYYGLHSNLHFIVHSTLHSFLHFSYYSILHSNLSSFLVLHLVCTLFPINFALHLTLNTLQLILNSTALYSTNCIALILHFYKLLCNVTCTQSLKFFALHSALKSTLSFQFTISWEVSW